MPFSSTVIIIIIFISNAPLVDPCLTSSLIVQLCSSSAYRVGQAVRLEWRLWWRGLLGSSGQWCPAGRGEEEQQETTFLHISHYVPQTHASSAPTASLHGNKWAGPYQLQQPHSSRTHWGDQWGAFQQRTFTGKTLLEEAQEAALSCFYFYLLHCLLAKNSKPICRFGSRPFTQGFEINKSSDV